jgi:hypothetical protein
MTPEDGGKADHAEHPPRPKMTLLEAQTRAEKTAKVVSLAGVSVAEATNCIDGRSIEDSARFPGGTFGMAASLLAGVATTLERAGADNTPFTPERILSRIEQEAGGVSFHSDTHQHEGAVACAGCGHAMGLLSNEAYGLGERFQKGLQAYAAELQKRLEANEAGVIQQIYDGGHEERAVFIIEDEGTEEYLSIPPNDGETQVFVVNNTLNMRRLETLAKALYAEFATELEGLGVKEEQLVADVGEAYGKQLAITAGKLAKGLPVYRVKRGPDGRVIVEATDLAF